MMESIFDFRTFDFDIMLNYHLFQKLKLIGRCKFDHLIITLKFPLTCGLKLPFNR
jgi:hypothetical protein